MVERELFVSDLATRSSSSPVLEGRGSRRTLARGLHPLRRAGAPTQCPETARSIVPVQPAPATVVNSMRGPARSFPPETLRSPAAQDPAGSDRENVQKAPHPDHVKGNALFHCSCLPQHRDVDIRPPRTMIQRRHHPRNRLTHITTPFLPCYASINPIKHLCCSGMIKGIEESIASELCYA